MFDFKKITDGVKKIVAGATNNNQFIQQGLDAKIKGSGAYKTTQIGDNIGSQPPGPGNLQASSALPPLDLDQLKKAFNEKNESNQTTNTQQGVANQTKASSGTWIWIAGILLLVSIIGIVAYKKLAK